MSLTVPQRGLRVAAILIATIGLALGLALTGAGAAHAESCECLLEARVVSAVPCSPASPTASARAVSDAPAGERSGIGTALPAAMHAVRGSQASTSLRLRI